MPHTARTLFVLLALALAAGAPASAQAPAAPRAPADSVFQDGIHEGATTAQAAGTAVWTLGGFVGGAMLGPVGAGLAYALASGSASALPDPVVTRIAKKEAHFQRGYQQAYSDKLTTRRRSSALVGGLTGTALFATAGMLLLGS